MSDEARLRTELERLGEQPLPGERSDAELVEAALAGLEGAETAPPEPRVDPERGRSRAPVIVGVVLTLAAALVLGWWLLPVSELLSGEPEDPGSLAPSVASDDDEGERAVARSHEPSPPIVEGPAPPLPPTPEPEPPAPLDASTTGPDGGGSDDASTDTGASGSRRRAAPRTADQMLEQAQRLVSQGKRPAAIGMYERLLERFPDSAQGDAARVSLGRLELRRGRASRALAHFDAYLARSAGSLVEEARYGRIRSLRALGRHEQELRSIEAFLAEHGQGLYAARLRERAKELRTP